MSRERLPNRRRSITDSITWGGSRVHVTAGFSDNGRLLETFIRGGGRGGSERDHMLDDIAVALARLLQHGDRLEALAAGVGRLPTGEPASILGAVVDRLLAIEAAI